MTATRTSTASAERVATRPRVGVLGIMQELYDEMLPGITERQGAYAEAIGAARRYRRPGRRSRAQPRGHRVRPARLRERRARRRARRHAHLRTRDARRA